MVSDQQEVKGIQMMLEAMQETLAEAIHSLSAQMAKLSVAKDMNHMYHLGTYKWSLEELKQLNSLQDFKQFFQ